MNIIGLTGGIGSGKSTVSELFKVYNIPVYDSDYRSKHLCMTDAPLIANLKELFGKELYHSNGQLNRSYMAKAIFSDKELLQASNKLIHPVVNLDFKKWANQQNALFIVQETAILFEAGLERNYNAIVCVTAPEELRIQRIMLRSGLKQEEVQARMNNQLSDEDRIRRSDYIVVNDDLTPLIPQMEKLMKILA